MIELLQRLWIPLLFVITVSNIAFSVMTRINHISHLDEKIQKLENKLDALSKETANQGERIARMEGKIYNGK